MNRLIVALALGATAATGALAQDGAGPRRGPGTGGGMGMMRADANGDGTVTREEYAAQVDARFARMDANGNGKLDTDEMPARGRFSGGPDAPPPPPPPAGANPPPPPPPPPPPAAGFTREQFRMAAMVRFDRMDANRDGRLDAGEMPRGPGPRPAAPAN